ncbi:MAG: hypothetical protein KH318_04840 [Oscillibacter sp.]|nr:hypothetical protein [Oscillibacter sp.]HAZ68230.1 hypothetical protein [Oscillibacter sp.]
MEEKTFVGYGYGRFQNDAGEMQNYCNVFMLEDFSGQESNDYHFGGQKAVKYGCVSPEVYKDIKPGTRARRFFDSRKKVSYMVPVDKA